MTDRHVDTGVLQNAIFQMVQLPLKSNVKDSQCAARGRDNSNHCDACVEIVDTRWIGILLLNWFVLLDAGCRDVRQHALVSGN